MYMNVVLSNWICICMLRNEFHKAWFFFFFFVGGGEAAGVL